MAAPMSVTVLVGNPKPRSRTLLAARLVAAHVAGREPDQVIDLVDFGPALLDWADAGVAEAVATVQASKLLIVASPTYKGTFTGLLKLFLDRIAGGALVDVTAVALMLGGDLRHSLAPEVFLKPVLSELGASCPTRGLFLLDADVDAATERIDSAALTSWLAVERARLAQHL
jgi:FMN reductase